MNQGAQGARILLVDDDAGVATMYGLKLGLDGFEVERASDGRAALQAIARQPPELVLLDVRMPGLDGFGVLAALAEQPVAPPVVMLSSYSDADLVRKALNLGALDWVTKGRLSPGQVSELARFWVERVRNLVPGEAGDPPVHNADQAVLVADDLARYLWASPGITELTGWTRQQIVGRRVWDLTPGGQLTTGLERWREFIRRGEDEGTYQLVTAAGREITVHYRAIANLAPGRHVSYLSKVS